MFSCSNEERNRLPSITPSHIDLSPEHPEAYFQIACGDYNMYGFIIVGQEEYRMNKNIDIRQPIAISFGFSVPDGISTVVVTLKQ